MSASKIFFGLAVMLLAHQSAKAYSVERGSWTRSESQTNIEVVAGSRANQATKQVASVTTNRRPRYLSPSRSTQSSLPPTVSNLPSAQRTVSPANSSASDSVQNSSDPAACVPTNKPSERCQRAFDESFSLMLVGFCKMQDYGYDPATFNLRRDQGCLRLKCLEGELAYQGVQAFGVGCTGEMKNYFSTITIFDYSANQCVTTHNFVNSLDQCQ